MGTILTVRELTRQIRAGLETRFPFVWVRGEVSNLSRPTSGHVYFSLKDSEALLNCVWFKTDQRGSEGFDPLTGEVFPEGPRPSLARALRDGERILCAGRITVYAPRGGYQLVVELAQPDGVGELALAFEARKRKLAAQGYFAPERKRKLPPHPVNVAVITAPGGAAVRDFLRIAEERGYGAHIRVYPVPVQGDAAAPAVAAALARVNAEGWAQVAVLIRGGGSLEDLWAFNEEIVADAVFASALPVLAGIGHEVDVSMADMTADVRAATPSHAAQILWPLRSDLTQRVDDLEIALQRAHVRRFETAAMRLQALRQALGWLSPARVLDRKCEAAARAHVGMRRAMLRLVAGRGAQLDLLASRLRNTDMAGRRERLLEHSGLRLRAQAGLMLHAPERALEQCIASLRALDPHAPLERGYALAYDGRGRLLRSVHDARKGDALRLRLRDGAVDATVSGIREERP
ncbi:MAG: exodeoxyribonuclease VII large subunit [Deltaproteobacteria bacterium]|jgi:exodeoxyribonuclease VII large subunit|nr:exodeoxyribonuclease VII large subunit [Deltaproteobacteria bacterium]